nr:hypothetical protein [Tanacetum cinerariifolium]
MRRVRKGFSRVETPLFETMLAERISVDMDQDKGVELVVDQEKNAEVEGRQADKQADIYNIDLDHSSKVLSIREKKWRKKMKKLSKASMKHLHRRQQKEKKLSEEAQEDDDLKKRLEIVQDEDDDVFVEATPLAQK